MCKMYQFLCGCSLNVRKMDGHGHGDAETLDASRQRAKRNRRVNRYGLAHPDVPFARDYSQGPDETGGIPRSKQLFWVSTFSFSTHFNRAIELKVDLPIVRFCGADSAAGNGL
jgi:hypothetical protein